MITVCHNLEHICSSFPSSNHLFCEFSREFFYIDGTFVDDLEFCSWVWVWSLGKGCNKLCSCTTKSKWEFWYSCILDIVNVNVLRKLFFLLFSAEAFFVRRRWWINLTYVESFEKSFFIRWVCNCNFISFCLKIQDFFYCSIEHKVVLLGHYFFDCWTYLFLFLRMLNVGLV